MEKKKKKSLNYDLQVCTLFPKQKVDLTAKFIDENLTSYF